MFLQKLFLLLCLWYFHKKIHCFSFDNTTLPGRKPFLPPSCGKLPLACNISSRFRRFDGSCTNPAMPSRGMPGDTYDYVLSPNYKDGISMLREARDLPSPRVLKNLMYVDGEHLSTQWNMVTMSWGQFMAHDISLILQANANQFKCCSASGRYQSDMSPQCMAIDIPTDDSVMSAANINCMNFTRVTTDYSLDCANNTFASPLNAVTSALDLSPIYGNSQEESDALRTKSGGLLSARIINNLEYLNIVPSSTYNCTVDYVTGDSRANQNMPLTALHNMMMREHNRLARRLHALNPHWSDERLFQEARRILIAQYQHVSYYDWVVDMLGEDVTIDSEIIFPGKTHVEDYVSTASPAPTVEFAHTAFRFFHTNIPNHIELMDPTRTIIRNITLTDNIFCQDMLENSTILEEITLGITVQAMSEFDTEHSESITQRFNKPPGMQFGLDVRSVDIQRGRDSGLGSYGAYRMVCNVGPNNNFEDYEDFISVDQIGQLKHLYASIDDVDVSVGGSLEEQVLGSSVGPTYQCFLIDQFLRLRQGDRLWYEHRAAGFTSAQLTAIKKSSSVAGFFCNSGEGITNIQPDAFSIPGPLNLPVSCSQIKDINLQAWQENP